MSRDAAVVVGSGPNGLAAAVALARAGHRVLVREARPTVGGGARSAELTLPGFTHDLCSAVHPLAVASPFLRRLPLARHGLVWIQPPLPLAHPLDDGSAVVLARDIDETAAGLGADGPRYRALTRPLVQDWEALFAEILAPPHVPRHPIALARFGLRALRSATALARGRFEGERARALFAGLAAHSVLPLERWGSAAVGLVLGVAGHAVGWPIPGGGAGRIAGALSGLLRELGGEVEIDSPVRSLDELDDLRPALLDVTPTGLLALGAERLPGGYRRRLRRFRYGAGAFKLDWALSGPIPWTAAECARAGTVHLGGTLGEIAESESAPWEGRVAERPFVLLAQPSLFDPERAPAGKHVAWAYCHVPNGWQADLTDRVEAQVERFAPGFRDRILARSVMGPRELEEENPNLVGGDISGGALDLRQVLARPRLWRPYATPLPGVYLCSASTPPGPGVHGMCGYFAAQAALDR